MLKRISVDDVRLGMFIERLEGSWLKHPFWKTRFVLDDAGRLANLKASAVEWVTIDTSKGLDVDPPEPRRAAGTNPVPAAARSGTARPLAPPSEVFARPAPATFGKRAPSAQHTSMRREFGTAQRVAAKAEKAISRVFLEGRLGKSIDTRKVEPVVEEIFDSIQRDPHTFNGLMRCKRGAPTVYRHAVAVSALMISLATRMKLHPRDIRVAGLAGLTMDIGEAQLEMAGAGDGMDLSGNPVAPERRHLIIGHEILSASNDIPEEVLRVCLYHHERLDGSGFPLGLQGDKIDPFSRMAAICDTFDRLISPDGDGTALDPARALQALADARDRFDPDILNTFIDSAGTYPIGSIVELRSGHLAMVVCSDPEGEDLPTVRTFHCLLREKAVRGENIDLRNCFGEDKIVGTHTIEGMDIRNAESLRERVLAAAIKDDF